jgi:hypothetical protein
VRILAVALAIFQAWAMVYNLYRVCQGAEALMAPDASRESSRRAGYLVAALISGTTAWCLL